MRDFRAFTMTHALVLIVCLACAALVLRVGLRLRDTPQQRGFERALGIGGVIIWITANAYGFLPAVFAWSGALPIQVCDLCALVAPIVLLQAIPPAWQRSMLYFWGIGLCTQAFLTPTLNEGPNDPRFWWFWLGHYVILIYALYDVIVRGWRPAWRHWGIAVVLSAAYIVVVLPLDVAFEWNYGFIGRETKAATMIEVLGPWPARVGVIYALGVLAFTCLMAPWAAARRLRH